MDSLDQEVLDRLGRDMGSTAAVARIVAMYLGKLPVESESLHSFAEAGDAARLADNAHRLKSSTAMLGATRLAGLLAEIESSAKAGNLDAAARWLGEFDREKVRVEADMKARFPG